MELTLHAEVAQDIDAECIAVFSDAVWRDLPHPCVEELRELAALVSADLRVVKVRRGGHLVALSVCSVDDVQVHGMNIRAYRMFGEALHDYGRLYSSDSDALESLLLSMRRDAIACNCDAVVLNSLLQPTNENVLPRRYTAVDTTVVFDAARDPRGWEGLLAKKSLRRHWNSAKKQPGFRVCNSLGAFTCEDIETVAAMHRERWHFDGKSSAFEQARRTDEYGVYSSNKLLTHVRGGDEVITVHYGMQYRNTLLWHTPIVNIKFLAYSPLELLLTAVAQYCQAASIGSIDFGLGDEEYKARFGNCVRKNYNVFIPISAKAYLLHMVRKSGLRGVLKGAAKQLRWILSRARDRGTALWSAVEWYEAEGREDAGVVPDGRQLVIIESYDEFVDFCRRYRLKPRRYQYMRFREGASFCALHGVRDVFTYGWVARRDDMRIGEIERTVHAPGRTILYDFSTPPAFRRKGHYTAILEALIRRLPGESLAIYALQSNTPSLSAIRRAGFVRKATFTGLMCGASIRIARKSFR